MKSRLLRVILSKSLAFVRLLWSYHHYRNLDVNFLYQRNLPVESRTRITSCSYNTDFGVWDYGLGDCRWRPCPMMTLGISAALPVCSQKGGTFHYKSENGHCALFTQFTFLDTNQNPVCFWPHCQEQFWGTTGPMTKGVPRICPPV
jgi:hypothetical protein